MRAFLTTAGLCAGALLAGCHSPPAAATHEQVPMLKSMDVGAGMLADVENARQALAGGAMLAAENDLDRGLSYSDQLAGDASALFPDNSQPAPRGSPSGTPARLSRFAAEVQMQSADAELDRGDVAGAEKDLAAIEASVPVSMLPATWSLTRAQESLDVATAAPSGNQPSALPTELKIAEVELGQYQGVPHGADAKALSTEIAQALARPGGAASIAPDRLSSWASKVSGWI